MPNVSLPLSLSPLSELPIMTQTHAKHVVWWVWWVWCAGVACFHPTLSPSHESKARPPFPRSHNLQTTSTNATTAMLSQIGQRGFVRGASSSPRSSVALEIENRNQGKAKKGDATREHMQTLMQMECMPTTCPMPIHRQSIAHPPSQDSSQEQQPYAIRQAVAQDNLTPIPPRPIQ